jgi:integrase
LANRKRNPLEATTISNRRYTLDKWLYPRIGPELLSAISNRTMKELVEYFVGANLAASSIRDYTLIAKLVVASAIDDNGEELFPRKWKEEYIDAPIVKDQNQPTVDAEGISAIIRNSPGQIGVLYALLAGCGPLRVGEALGLEIRHISGDFRTLVINQKAKRGVIQPYLKTKNGEREVDLCTELADMLRNHVGSRASGLLFQNTKGTQLSQANLLNDHLHPVLKQLNLPIGGFNIFRRFRMKHIDLSPVPKSLQHFWSGHAQTHISETYVHLLNDRPIRLEWAERLGMGFTLPGQPGQLIGLRKSA